MEPTQPHKGSFVFRLYNADRSVEMREIAKRIQEVVFNVCGSECRVEVIDVLTQPEQAVEAGVFLTPTLVRELPEPMRRVIGDLSEPDKSLALFGILTAHRGDCESD